MHTVSLSPGFLCDRADFAEQCAENGIQFIGPSSQVLDLVYDKSRIRQKAAEFDLPVVPGSKTAVGSYEEALNAAESLRLVPVSPSQLRPSVSHFLPLRRCGFPVILKPLYGNEGMTMVETPRLLHDALVRARSEARAAYGDGSLFVERYLSFARHVEVQLLADSEGNVGAFAPLSLYLGNPIVTLRICFVVHLSDRDSSLQRGYDKIFHVAPAPNIPTDIRANMRSDAVRLAKSVGLESAGSVAFLLDSGETNNCPLVFCMWSQKCTHCTCCA